MINMSKHTVYNQDGKQAGTAQLPEAVFSVTPNNEVLAQAVYVLESNARIPVAHARTRDEVSGGGRKPWRQKGTGRARHGSIRSPIWKGGGVTHGPRNDTNRTKKLNRKVAVKAFAMALSGKVRDNELLLLDSLSVGGKTATAATVLKNLSTISGFEKIAYQKGNRALIAVPEKTDELARAFGNIESVDVEEIGNLNVLDVLGYQYLVIVSPEEAADTLLKKVDKAHAKPVEEKKKQTGSAAPARASLPERHRSQSGKRAGGQAGGTQKAKKTTRTPKAKTKEKTITTQ